MDNVLLPSLKTVSKKMSSSSTTTTTKDKENEEAKTEVPSKGYNMDWMNDPSVFPGGQLPAAQGAEIKKKPENKVEGPLATRILHKVRFLFFSYQLHQNLFKTLQYRTGK